MRVKRVVTGHDDVGRAVVVASEDVPGFDACPGATIWSPWRSDSPARYPDGGGDPPPSTFAFPPVGGFGVSIISTAGGWH